MWSFLLLLLLVHRREATIDENEQPIRYYYGIVSIMIGMILILIVSGTCHFIYK